jgi:hypothetical protein
MNGSISIMPRARFAVVAAVALSMVPVSAPAVAMPYLAGPAVVAGEGGPLVEVSHRRYGHCHRNVRRHHHRNFHGSRWHRHVGRGCYPRIVRRHHRHYHRNCIKIGDVRICF